MAQEPTTQGSDETKKHVRVFGPDNRYYQFPQGTTKEAAVSFFKKKGITSPESSTPKSSTTPEAKPPESTKPEAPKTQTPQDIQAQQAQAQIARFRPRWDDPQQILKDPDWYGRSGKYLGGVFVGGVKAGAGMAVGGAKFIHDIASALDPIEGYHRPLGEPQLQVGKDVVDIGKGILDVGKATWDLIRHFPEAAADPEKFGSTIANVAMLVDGGVKLSKTVAEGMAKSPKAKLNPAEAVGTAHKVTTGAPSRLFRRKAFEDAYVHAKGLEIAKKVSKAANAIHEEVKTHSDGLAREIDTKIPSGTISAADEAATILKEFNDVVKTPEKAHPVLVQMVKDAQATAPKLWSWEKTRQFRSSVGRAMSKVDGPQKVVLTRVYKDLTNKLGGTAKQYGLEKSWNHYNELARKVDQEFGDAIDSIRDAQSGQEVANRLGKDIGLTTELSKNLSKYGLDFKEVLNYISTAKRLMRNKDFINRSIFRLVYGSPAGLTTAIGMRMAGAPYIASMGAGFLVGATSANLINLARVLRLSPDVIEHMMKERELPGRMQFKAGTFPSESALGLPETTGGPTPSEAPPTPKPSAPKQLKGGISAQGVESSTAPRTRESDIQSHSAEIERLKKILDNPKATAEEKASAKNQIKTHEELRSQKISEGEHGTGKLAQQAKARERVSKARAKAKRTRESEASEANARAQATHMDVSQLQIPEMEEYVRTKNPTAYSGLQKLRKSKGITDGEYTEALKYYVLEHLEE